MRILDTYLEFTEDAINTIYKEFSYKGDMPGCLNISFIMLDKEPDVLEYYEKLRKCNNGVRWVSTLDAMTVRVGSMLTDDFVQSQKRNFLSFNCQSAEGNKSRIIAVYEGEEELLEIMPALIPGFIEICKKNEDWQEYPYPGMLILAIEDMRHNQIPKTELSRFCAEVEKAAASMIYAQMTVEEQTEKSYYCLSNLSEAFQFSSLKDSKLWKDDKRYYIETDVDLREFLPEAEFQYLPESAELILDDISKLSAVPQNIVRNQEKSDCDSREL